MKKMYAVMFLGSIGRLHGVCREVIRETEMFYVIRKQGGEEKRVMKSNISFFTEKDITEELEKTRIRVQESFDEHINLMKAEKQKLKEAHEIKQELPPKDKPLN